MNRKTAIIISCSALLLAATSIGLSMFKDQQKSKIGLIRTADFLDLYLGMQTAESIFKEDMTKRQRELEILALDIEAKVNYIQDSIDASNIAVRNKRVQELAVSRSAFKAKQEDFQEYMHEQDAKLTEIVLNQANEFIVKFGKERGFDVILGTNDSGTLLYVDDVHDVTDEAIEEINKQFSNNAI